VAASYRSNCHIKKIQKKEMKSNVDNNRKTQFDLPAALLWQAGDCDYHSKTDYSEVSLL
jgi:hypothetical protein